jgi:hypothetical protein
VQPTRSNTPTWWWFLIPALTLGSTSFLMVFVGGSKLKSGKHMLAAGAYFLANAFCLFGIVLTPSTTNAAGESTTSTAGGIVLAVYLVIAWLGGTLHTLYLQLKVAKLPPEPVALRPHSLDPAIAAAQWRAGRRAEARQLLETNPGMAWELRIGRPDIKERPYDDGGLVDVNHVPASWLAYSLQIPEPLADEIAAARTQHNGLTTPAELIYYCPSMTNERLEVIREFLVFRPL